MAIRGQGLVDGDANGNGEGSSNAQEPVVYVLHPNCAVEEF
jgi:DNA replication licensing factor MCM6